LSPRIDILTPNTCPAHRCPCILTDSSRSFSKSIIAKFTKKPDENKAEINGQREKTINQNFPAFDT
ncbi:MAG: hypothetical protein M0Z75_02790, partial [Nitrospiraceae bacterium]|nr:hypothetical protein [Nitrospiraceae bacterium]